MLLLSPEGKKREVFFSLQIFIGNREQLPEVKNKNGNKVLTKGS